MFDRALNTPLHLSSNFSLNFEHVVALYINIFQSIDVFHIETSHLICSPNQMTSFYIKCNTELKLIKLFFNRVY